MATFIRRIDFNLNIVKTVFNWNWIDVETLKIENDEENIFLSLIGLNSRKNDDRYDPISTALTISIYCNNNVTQS